MGDKPSEERTREAADRSTQPGLDRQGGTAAVPDDSGFQARFSQWQEFLARPEVRAGLLQFSAQILQTNPGGLGPALGTSIAAGLGAAGRVTSNRQERGQEQSDRAAAARQQQLENEQADRGLTDRERRTELFGQQGRGRGVAGSPPTTGLEARIEVWRDHFASSVGLGEPAIDPSTLRRLSVGAAGAENDPDGDVMAAGLAAGLSDRQVAEAYSNPQTRLDLKARLRIGAGVATPAPPGGGDDAEVEASIPQVTQNPGEPDEAFELREQERADAVAARETTRTDRGEPQRLRADTANRQNQVRSKVQEELASGRSTVEQIADTLIARGFTDRVSLDLLQAEFPQIWDIVTAKLTGT